MTGLIITYVVFLLAIALYVGINIYHVIRFRLRDKDDKSILALSVYVLLISVIFLVSVIGGTIAYIL